MAAPPARPPQPGTDLERMLAETFGHPGFREGQREAIEATLAGRDVVAVMPTGGGKSLLYQLPALLLPGVTLVVSPLIALMKDQVDALLARGLPATFVNSTLGPSEQDERLQAAARGAIKLLYLAPERFRNERFRAAVQRLKVSLLAIDEAHCISEWGHDFRPDYRRLDEAVALLGQPPVVALTATATPEVRDDIVRELKLGGRDPLTLVTGFDRKNLFVAVEHVAGDAEKLQAVERAIDEAQGPGVIYVASRKSAEKVVDWLRSRRRPAGLYHAGLGDEERERVQDEFMTGKLALMVATNAFGMGIDKADIRFVVHYEFPKTLEAYYQEIGRAGRDGLPARATLLFSYPDKRIQDFFVEGANPSLQLVQQVYRALIERDGGSEDATAAQIAIALGQRNDMAVSSALAVLDRAGVIAREAVPGSRARLLRLLKRVDPGALPIDGPRLERKLEADRRKLEAVVQYAYHTGCRKERLLAYFGDTRRRRTCDSCDVCARRGADTRELAESETDTARACLEAVRTLRFGRVRIAEILAGGAGETVERFGLEDCPSYGQLRHLGTKGALGWLDSLLDAGLIEKEELRGGPSYILRLSAAGRRALSGDTRLALAPPAAARPPAPPARAGRTAAANPAERRAPRRERRPVTPPADDAAAGAGADGALLALKAWRRDEARRRAVPAYVVFHDKVLEAVASARPATREDLALLPGFGRHKLEEYGDALLEVLRQCR